MVASCFFLCFSLSLSIAYTLFSVMIQLLNAARMCGRQLRQRERKKNDTQFTPFTNKVQFIYLCLDCFPFLWHFNNHLSSNWRTFRVCTVLQMLCIKWNYLTLMKIILKIMLCTILWFTHWHFVHVEVTVSCIDVLTIWWRFFFSKKKILISFLSFILYRHYFSSHIHDGREKHTRFFNTLNRLRCIIPINVRACMIHLVNVYICRSRCYKPMS